MKGNCYLGPKWTEEGMKGQMPSEKGCGVSGAPSWLWGWGTWVQPGFLLPLPCPT